MTDFEKDIENIFAEHRAEREKIIDKVFDKFGKSLHQINNDNLKMTLLMWSPFTVPSVIYLIYRCFV